MGEFDFDVSSGGQDVDRASYPTVRTLVGGQFVREKLVCFSTIRTVIDSQFVREKLSIALLFWLETLLLKSLLVDKMLIGTLDSTIRTAIGGQFVREKLVCFSTIRTVIDSQFVREKLSIALLFWLETLLLKSLLVDKMLIGTLDSTIRTAIGGQFVREKLSIAFLFWRENLFLKALLVDMMLTGSCHSTIRAVFACQIVLEKLSIALLFWRKTVFHVTSGGQDVDGEVVFHGKICYWQSICSRDINRPFVCNCPLRASFLSGELVLEVFFGEPDVDRSEFVNENNCWYYSSHFFSMDGIYFRSYFRRNRCWLRSVCISTSLFFTSLIDWIFFCSIYYYDKKIILTSETYYKNQETSKSKW